MSDSLDYVEELEREARKAADSERWSDEQAPDRSYGSDYQWRFRVEVYLKDAGSPAIVKLLDAEADAQSYAQKEIEAGHRVRMLDRQGNLLSDSRESAAKREARIEQNAAAQRFVDASSAVSRAELKLEQAQKELRLAWNAVAIANLKMANTP